MTSTDHTKHIAARICMSNCPECSADRERRLATTTPFHYGHVAEYLNYIRPRLQAIHAGNNTVDAHVWLRNFHNAMDRRISSHLGRRGRKYADGYLERLRMATGGNSDAQYLRRFADRNASALD